MSGLYLYSPARSIDLAASQAALATMLEWAVRLPSDQIVSTAHEDGAGAVIHHGLLPGWGKAVCDSQRYVLIIGGQYWIEPHAARLARPAEALTRLMGRTWNEWPSLRGSYAFAFFDLQARRVIIENDLHGTVPLYYHQSPGALLVASELKSLRPFLAAEFDVDAVAELMLFGYVATQRTLVQGTLRLPPNHRLIYEQGSLSVQSLRRPVFTRQRLPDDELQEQLYDCFLRSIRRVAQETPELSVSLSGGLDSRLVCLAGRQAGASLAAVTMGQPGSQECRVACRFAQTVNVPIRNHEHDGRRFADWFERAVWVTEARCPPAHMHFLDGMFQGSYYPLPQLHGLLGDVVLGGDYDVPATSSTGVEQACRESLRPQVWWPDGSLERCCSRALRNALQNVLERVFADYARRLDFAAGYSEYLWFRYQFRGCAFIHTALASQVQPWTDLVAPYLDSDFFDLCSEIDHAAILDRQVQLRWALAHFSECRRLPRVKDGVLVPIEPGKPGAYTRGYARLGRRRRWRYLLTRLTRGRINLAERESYPHYDQWYRRWPSVRNFTRQTLLDGPDFGLWNSSGLARLLDDQRIGRNVWPAVSSVLLATVFQRQFVLGNSLREPLHFL